MHNKKTRIAIVHDCIISKGGAERVLLNMHKTFPEASIYTSIYNREKSYPEFKKCNIKTSWLQALLKTERAYKNTFFLLGAHAMQSHDLSGFDIVLISSTQSAKYVRATQNNFVINYCYTPFRLVWNPNSYNLYENAKGLKKFILKQVIHILKKIDYNHAQKTNKYIAMTNETADRIRKHYHVKNDIKIINPTIDTSKYFVADNIDDYYLVVSRLEKYKKVDLAIEAFNKLDRKLKIVGHGTEEIKLKKLANSNIEFLGSVNQKDLKEIYSKCKALVFPQYEDYGLTPLEANACGRPVVAYGFGGIRSTMLPYKSESNSSGFTAVFFNNQTIGSLIDAIKHFEKLKVNTDFIRKHAEKFDDHIFIRELKSFVETEYKNYKKY